MAYSKDLGRVKGDKGNVYVPSLAVENGYLILTWTETFDNDRLEEYESRVKLPVYYPTKTYDANNNEIRGTITFVPNIDVVPGNDETRVFDVLGPQGPEGKIQMDVEVITDKGGYTDILDIITNQTKKPDPLHPEPLENVIYVIDNNAYIYDEQYDEKVFLLEKFIDLSQYYTKNETYSQAEMNEMFRETASYMELMLLLLDVNEG